MRQPGNQLH